MPQIHRRVGDDTHHTRQKKYPCLLLISSIYFIFITIINSYSVTPKTIIMKLLIFLLAITFSSCGQNDSKQKELALKERELAVKEKELNLQKDSLNAINKIAVSDQPDKDQNNSNQSNSNETTADQSSDNNSSNEQPSDPSKFTGSWVGQGQDYIEIKYSNGQYFITLDADNSSQAKKTIIKAKEENGKLIVEPGIYYGYNGTSTMTLTGKKKLVLKSGKNTYSYGRP
jgi:hypothetical protein